MMQFFGFNPQPADTAEKAKAEELATKKLSRLIEAQKFKNAQELDRANGAKEIYEAPVAAEKKHAFLHRKCTEAPKAEVKTEAKEQSTVRSAAFVYGGNRTFSAAVKFEAKAEIRPC